MAETITATHAADSGHFYTKDGEPAYTIIGKNGKERNTTLRDARKLSLVPSVTTIIAAGNAPALVEWKINQAILSALTATRGDNETEADFVSRIKSDAKEQARKAAERGTLIHYYVQSSFEESYVSDDAIPFVESVRSTMCEHDILYCDWIPEKSFATEKYGGKADLSNSQYLIDIKTKTWDDKDKLAIWDTHIMQLAAYRQGLNIPEAKCGILYVHQETAESVLLWSDEKQIIQGLEMFNGILNYYYAKTGL